MLAFALMIAQALASPTPACVGPDITVTAVTYKIVVKGTATVPDRIVLNANVTNASDVSQTPGVIQHVELLRDGQKVVEEPVRALRAHERDLVALRIFRQPDDEDPAQVTLRYVPDDSRARHGTATTRTTACKDL